TLRTTPQLVTRERQNLGRNRSNGLEVDAAARLGSRLFATLGYAFIAASVARAPGSPNLVGKWVPQVARHQLTFGARFADRRRLELSLQGRIASRQFEDDLNQLPLAGYLTLDARVQRRLRRLAAFAAMENLTGALYDVGRTPAPTVGPPRAFRFGLRF